MAEMFTLCVPTKNRPEFLARLLGYYARTGYRHRIFIGDASDPEPAGRNERIARSFGGRIHVRYFGQPGSNVVESLESLSAEASTPYCGWVCDDDFLCAQGIERCIRFLESRDGEGYAAAHGRGILFQIGRPGPTGAVADLRPYLPSVLEQETAAGRLRAHLDRGSPSFHMAVRRAGPFHEMFTGFGRMRGARQGFIFDELILSSLAAIQGKVKVLDGLYLVRQAHEGIYRQVDGYDWVTDPDWHPSFSVFRKIVVEALSREDRLSPEEAGSLFKEAFWPYLAGLLVSSRRKRQAGEAGRLGRSRFRRIVESIPGLKSAWRQLRLRRNPLFSDPDLAPVIHAVTYPPSLPGYEMPGEDRIPASAGMTRGSEND